MREYKAEKLLEFVRDGLVEQEHSGFLVSVFDNSIKKIGEDNDYPFYLRSCAKPLQAALLVDFGVADYFKITDEEIAICCASHAGEECHTSVVKGILDKIGLDESFLKCGLHKPISKSEQNKLLLNNSKENILQNNCSGKHTMMLAICKKMGWDIKTYDEKNHPLQLAIKEKIYELTEVHNTYPITQDGCGVPILAMPLFNMVKGYMNLFLDEKYSIIKKAFLNNTYLIGGEDRLDSAIMGANPSLIAKVGAGGLCIVLNLSSRAGVIVKILDCDMKARALVLIEALKQLGWLDDNMLENSLIKAQNKKDITTLHGEKIGEAKFCYEM